MRSMVRCVLMFTLALAACAAPARAGFHLMQIEQIIGGVNGDATAQAIQLRMRATGQIFTGGARLRAWDANGQNPIVVFQFTNNIVNGAAGSRILICTPSFAALTSPAAVNDRTITNVIPQSYLASGKLTFESSIGQIYWAVAWGGYTGPNTGIAGAAGNDADGQFSPAFSLPLESNATRVLKFPGLFTDLSTNNAADYIMTTGSSTWVNNNGGAFVLPPATGPCCFNFGLCQVMPEFNCSLLVHSSWTAGGTCAPDPCPPVTGACCFGSICSVTTIANCDLMGGFYSGHETACFADTPNNFVLCCRANFDQQNGVGVPDIFAFLSAWFGNLPSADFDGNGTREVPDIFAFLSAWFAGCS